MTRRVQFFVTCLVDTFFPETGEAVVDVLTRLGVEVDFPEAQTCCGQPAFNAGRWEDARPLARHTLDLFDSLPGDVVLPSGSCTAMIRQGFLELFAESPEDLSRAEALAARTYEFTEYLVDILGVVDVGARWEGKITYHPSCHLLRSLGVDRQPRALLSNIRGAEFVELPNAEECCGFGGVFSVEHPEISGEMLTRKLENIAASGAPVVVTADTGCRMQIQGGLKRRGMPQRVIHIAEILANR
jgi:L-lactate dehydrogenase complex protein LldE